MFFLPFSLSVQLPFICIPETIKLSFLHFLPSFQLSFLCLSSTFKLSIVYFFSSTFFLPLLRSSLLWNLQISYLHIYFPSSILLLFKHMSFLFFRHCFLYSSILWKHQTNSLQWAASLYNLRFASAFPPVYVSKADLVPIDSHADSFQDFHSIMRSHSSHVKFPCHRYLLVYLCFASTLSRWDMSTGPLPTEVVKQMKCLILKSCLSCTLKRNVIDSVLVNLFDI
jgi:hypothetical protein